MYALSSNYEKYAEEEAGCDIGSGPDLGGNLGYYFATAVNYINREKLMLVLREGMTDLLSQENLEAIANDVQLRIRERIMQKFQSAL